jgi:hypothetical protein
VKLDGQGTELEEVEHVDRYFGIKKKCVDGIALALRRNIRTTGRDT